VQKWRKQKIVDPYLTQPRAEHTTGFADGYDYMHWRSNQYANFMLRMLNLFFFFKYILTFAAILLLSQ